MGRNKGRGPLTPKRKGRRDPVQMFGCLSDGKAPEYMCTKVLATDVARLASSGVPATPGQFVISRGGHGNIEFFGPFASLEEASDYGEQKFGVTRWMSGPMSL